MNKQKMFEWLQKSASTLQHGFEAGLEKTKQASAVINSKIDENPRASAARDLFLEFTKAQTERLSDVRIRGTRLGDIPQALQKLSERQLLKLLIKVREADPDINWDAIMPNPEEMPIFAAFETLGLPYGTPYDEVKKQYRKLMRVYHPDKHGDSPEDEKLATEKTQELTAAYELICDHYGK